MSYDSQLAALSPVGWWKLGDASGSSTVADSSGNGHTGTPTGTGTTLGNTGIVPNDGTATAAATDANDSDYLDFGNASALLPSTGTILIWVKGFTDPPNTGLRFIFGQDGSFNISSFAGNGFLGSWDYNASTYRGTGSSIQDGNLHMLALTFQIGVASGSQMYLDGAAVGSPYTLGTTSTGHDLRIGASAKSSAGATVAIEAFGN